MGNLGEIINVLITVHQSFTRKRNFIYIDSNILDISMFTL